MAKVREHNPIVIEEINGLWARGDEESCPTDHLLLANNIQFFHSGIGMRTAVKPYARLGTGGGFPSLARTKRVYNFITQRGQTLLVMVDGGAIYHVVTATEINPVTTFAGADDFAFIAIAGRAYISPFKIQTDPVDPTQTFALPLPNTYVWVYDGNLTAAQGLSSARLAAGEPPKNADGANPKGKAPFMAYNSSFAGKVTAGIHSISVGFNNGTLGIAILVDAPGEKAIELANVPIGPAGTTSRTIHMSRKAPNNQNPYSNPWYVAATINDNTTTAYRLDISDEELLTPSNPNLGIPAPVTTALKVLNTTTEGFCDLGFHLVAVVYETNTGYLTAPGPEFYGGGTYVDEKKSVQVTNIPVSPDPFVIKRHLVSTKWIPEYNGDQKGYQFFFIPKGTLENNTDTQLTVSYYDSDLVADASHLIENFSKIPAGVNFCEYHSRMVVVADGNFPKNTAGVPDTKKPDNRSIAWVSAPGEPEAINQVDGIIITPLDGKPLTNCQDFRDNLYLFKQTRTYAYTDNGDEPSTWEMEVLDQGIGASVHGIAEVLDSGSVNVDYLIVTDWSGLMLFNGTYARPELSWKIENIWMAFDRNKYHNMQVVNDSIRKKLWILDPYPLTSTIYLADYGNGLNPKDIRWAKWIFDARITSIALIKTDALIIGTWQPNPAELLLPNQEAFEGISFYPPPFPQPPYEFPAVWPPLDDEIPVFPPTPPIPPETVGGGLVVVDPTNFIRHDEYYSNTGNPIQSQITPVIRTAFLGG